jgi:hypothetical protein
MIKTRRAIKALEEALKRAAYGSQLSHQALNAIAGLPLSKHPHVVTAVRRLLAKHHDRKLVCIRGAGYSIESIKVSDSGYLITNVLAMDDQPDGKGNKAFLVVYRPLGEEEKSILEAAPQDTSIVQFLMSRKTN